MSLYYITLLITKFYIIQTPELIASYLLHSGYMKTFDSFVAMNPMQCNSLLRKSTSKEGREVNADKESVSGSENDESEPSEKDTSKLTERNEIVQKIISGDVEGAMAAAEKHFPSIKELIWPMLIGQLVIEETRNGNLEKAITTASDPLGNTSTGPHPLVSQAMGLLAYKEPDRSPLSSLLDQSQRRRTAGSVNSAIMSHLKVCGFFFK